MLWMSEALSTCIWFSPALVEKGGEGLSEERGSLENEWNYHEMFLKEQGLQARQVCLPNRMTLKRWQEWKVAMAPEMSVGPGEGLASGSRKQPRWFPPTAGLPTGEESSKLGSYLQGMSEWTGPCPSVVHSQFTTKPVHSRKKIRHCIPKPKRNEFEAFNAISFLLFVY